MKFYLTIFAALLISQVSFSEEFEVEGKAYSLIENKSDFSCSNFTIESLEKRLPRSVNQNLVRGGLGHLDDPRIISHTLTYSNESVKKTLPRLESLLTNYDKISPRRSYIPKANACPGNNGVLFRMWGGGNCSTVCEAYALVIFTKLGEISKIKGLTYSEYNNCSNYKCPAYETLNNIK